LAAAVRAVALAEKLLPRLHPDRARAYETLAFVQGALKQLDASTATYDKAIAVLEKLDDPARLSRVLYNVASGLQEAGQCERALPRFERAAKVAAETAKARMI